MDGRDDRLEEGKKLFRNESHRISNRRRPELGIAIGNDGWQYRAAVRPGAKLVFDERPATASSKMNRFADRGVKAFARMHSFLHESHLSSCRSLRTLMAFPPANLSTVARERQPENGSSAFKHASFMIHAGPFAGVFFGRLNRPFGFQPSRRFSGPSAEFISVNRLTASLMPLFAPMNNPYLRLRSVAAT